MKRITGPAAALLAGALGLAGCSSAATTSSSTSAATSTTAVGTSTSAATMDGTALAEVLVTAMREAQSGRMTLTTSGATGAAAAGALTGDVQFAIGNGQTDTRATMTVAGQTMEILSVQGVTYIKSPFLSASANGAPWVKLDPAGTDPLSQSLAETLSDTSPEASVEAYRGSTAILLDTSADGVQHYRLTGVDGTGPSAASGPSTASGPAMTVDIWIDRGGRPTRTSTTVESMTVEATFTDWGLPVSITAPPADQVGTLPGM